MKNLLTALMILATLMFLAAPAVGDWVEDDGHKMHFPQLPDPQGWDVKFGPFEDSAGNEGIKVLADDWQCSADGPVRDIHFWFSSKGDAFSPDTAGIQNIHTSIWSNDPGVPGVRPSQPKDLLWWGDSEKGDFGSVTVRGPFSGDQAWYDPNLPFDQGFNPIPNDHDLYWQVNITDIAEPFRQRKGEIYWLDLYMEPTAAGGTTPIELGWKTADTERYPDPYTGKHFMDDAFFGHLDPDPLTGKPLVDWKGPLEDLSDPAFRRSIDLAFVITPEPSTIVMLLGLGLMGLAAVVRPRRK